MQCQQRYQLSLWGHSFHTGQVEVEQVGVRSLGFYTTLSRHQSVIEWRPLQKGEPSPWERQLSSVQAIPKGSWSGRLAADCTPSSWGTKSFAPEGYSGSTWQHLPCRSYMILHTLIRSLCYPRLKTIKEFKVGKWHDWFCIFNSSLLLMYTNWNGASVEQGEKWEGYRRSPDERWLWLGLEWWSWLWREVTTFEIYFRGRKVRCWKWFEDDWEERDEVRHNFKGTGGYKSGIKMSAGPCSLWRF